MFLEVQGNSLTVLPDIEQRVSAGYQLALLTAQAWLHFRLSPYSQWQHWKVSGTRDVRVGEMIEQKCFLREQCQKPHRGHHLRLIGYCLSDVGFVRYRAVCNFCGTDFKSLNQIDCHF